MGFAVRSTSDIYSLPPAVATACTSQASNKKTTVYRTVFTHVLSKSTFISDYKVSKQVYHEVKQSYQVFMQICSVIKQVYSDFKQVYSDFKQVYSVFKQVYPVFNHVHMYVRYSST